MDQRLDHVARQARAADPGYSAVAPVPGYSQERWARHAHPGVGQPTAAVEPYEPDDDYRTDWGTAFRQRAIRGAACVISPDETRDPLLDNFEQVIAAAVLVAEPLRSAPDLRVLVTSGVRRHLAGEHEYEVPPLDQAAQIQGIARHYEAMQLFIERAQAVRAGFAVANADRRSWLRSAGAWMGIRSRLGSPQPGRVCTPPTSSLRRSQHMWDRAADEALAWLEASPPS